MPVEKQEKQFQEIPLQADDLIYGALKGATVGFSVPLILYYGINAALHLDDLPMKHDVESVFALLAVATAIVGAPVGMAVSFFGRKKVSNDTTAIELHFSRDNHDLPRDFQTKLN